MSAHDQEFQSIYKKAVPWRDDAQAALDRGITNSLDQFQRAFDASTVDVVCMDERAHAGLRVAGAGCLQSPEAIAQQARLFETRTGRKINALWSHSGCGAAALAKVDAGEAARERAAAIGVPYAGNQEVTPEDHHVAVGLVYIGDTLSGALHELPEFPPMFGVNRNFHEQAETALAEAQVGIDIAFGDHGYGPENFSADRPFLLIALAESDETAEGLAAELRRLNFDADKVRIQQMTYHRAA